jgi:hypothetical protein
MRVIVNRIWREHFGTGLVETPSNFGIMGERPTNPELLEYLAGTFAKNGMSMKKLHRDIMLSAVYQLSTENSETAVAKDADNRLYWRANRKRMDAEQLRDSIMFVSGNLETHIGGPSEPLTPELQAPHRLRQGQPLQARRVPATLRLPESEHQRRKALHHHSAVAAPVPDEQRLHATASRRTRQARRPPNRITAPASARRTRSPSAASRTKRKSRSASST